MIEPDERSGLGTDGSDVSSQVDIEEIK